MRAIQILCEEHRTLRGVLDALELVLECSESTIASTPSSRSRRWHACECQRLDSMRAEIEGAAYGDPFSRDCFTVAATRYIDLQRQHTDHEDAELLPLARAVLTPDDDEIILAEYARLEQRHMRIGERTPCEVAARIVARATELALERQPSLLRGGREAGVRGSAVRALPCTPLGSR